MPQADIQFRLFVAGLILVLVPFLLSTDGRLYMSDGKRWALVTALAMLWLWLAYPYIWENAMHYWKWPPDKTIWPACVLMVSAACVAILAWHAASAHTASKLVSGVDNPVLRERAGDATSLASQVASFNQEKSKLEKARADAVRDRDAALSEVERLKIEISTEKAGRAQDREGSKSAAGRAQSTWESKLGNKQLELDSKKSELDKANIELEALNYANEHFLALNADFTPVGKHFVEEFMTKLKPYQDRKFYSADDIAKCDEELRADIIACKQAYSLFFDREAVGADLNENSTVQPREKYQWAFNKDGDQLHAKVMQIMKMLDRRKKLLETEKEKAGLRNWLKESGKG
jgi:hypothetical protein